MIYLSVISALFLLDYTIKKYIVKKWKWGSFHNILDNRIILTNYENHGAILNLGEKKPQLVKLFSLFTCIVYSIFFIAGYIKKGVCLFTSGLALIVAGGAGNTYDRIHKGYVTDYFSFNVKKSSFLSGIVFNLSDMFIFTGVLMMLIAAIKDSR